MTTLRVGISTCPNDIFSFYGLIEKRVDLRGLNIEFVYEDVQTLNEALPGGTLDFVKASFHAALYYTSTYGVLRAGSALGVGVGPLLVAARPDVRPGPESRIVCPGALTTAALLFRGFFPECPRIEHVVFSEIAPMLQNGDADFGVLIHEGRFTYQRDGLHLVEDLGETWERTTHGPLPLGGILARRALSDDVVDNFLAVLQDSIRYAFAHRAEVLPTLRRFAQELDETVIWSHVDLYVNDYTLDLGDIGEQALRTLESVARRGGILGPDAAPVTIMGVG